MTVSIVGQQTEILKEDDDCFPIRDRRGRSRVIRFLETVASAVRNFAFPQQLAGLEVQPDREELLSLETGEKDSFIADHGGGMTGG